jgi:hypothetical protein
MKYVIVGRHFETGYRSYIAVRLDLSGEQRKMYRWERFREATRFTQEEAMEFKREHPNVLISMISEEKAHRLEIAHEVMES